MASGSTGRPPGALPITAPTSMVPKALSHVPQALASASVILPRYPAGMCIPWWCHQLLRQDWSLLSVQKKYIQVEKVMTLYLKLTLDSICEWRLTAITLGYVGRSKRAWHFYILQADSGNRGPQAPLELWCFVIIWFGGTPFIPLPLFRKRTKCLLKQ